MFVYGVWDQLRKCYVYIGQSVNPIEHRFSEHKRASSTLGQALRAHPWRYHVELLSTCANQQALDIAEKRLIRQYGTLKFFNIRLGGHRGKLKTKGRLAHRTKKRAKIVRPEQEFSSVLEYAIDSLDYDPDVLKEPKEVYA